MNATRNNAAWIMEPGSLETMLRGRVAFEAAMPAHAEIEARREAAAKKAIQRVNGKVAVLRIRGPIEQHESDYLWWVGGTSTESFAARFDEVLRDQAVKAIVLDIDSPGGSVAGTPELAAKILKARDVKPIYAVANSMAASAALWIGSAATEFIVTPSGEVGSVGVWMAHVDISKALDAEGVKVTLVSAGEYKVEGNPWEPLGEEAQAEFQRGVDAIYAEFLKAVATHRGVTVKVAKDTYGKGRMLFAKDALAVGLVDRIASLEEVLGKLLGDASEAEKRQGRANAMKARQAWRAKQEAR